MTRRAADDLWGADPVEMALAEPCPCPEAVSDDLLGEFERWADHPRLLSTWALRLPWPRFCAVVRLIEGETACTILEGREE